MNDALSIAATGMQVQQQNLDTIAHNLANVNTPGFKRSRVTFTDLVTREATLVQPLDPSGTPEMAGPLSAVRAGSGVAIASVTRAFDMGDLRQTGSSFDLAIRGDGFLEVILPDGSRAYSRGGTLHVNDDGLLADEVGNALNSRIGIPADATALSIDAAGRVKVTVPGQLGPVDAGQLELVRFGNPGALAPLGANEYRATEGSGEGMTMRPGQDGAGVLAQGYLEASNVKLVDEMVGLMMAQRAYEANAKVVQASDEMLGMINGLRR
jgi:flagellar basal-body rod protein FlgG